MTARRWTMAIVLAMSVAVLPGVATSSASSITHCAYRLVPVGSTSSGVTPVDTTFIGCFSTFSDSIRAGTGMQIPEELAGPSLTQSTLDAYLPTATTDSPFLIGREFDNTNYGGSFLEYFAPNSCVGHTWEDNFVDPPWNDRLESGKGFSNCDHNRKWENADFKGAVLLCTSDCSSYGVLNNEVSSLRWKD